MGMFGGLGKLGGIGKIAEQLNPANMAKGLVNKAIDGLPLPKELKGIAKGVADKFVDKAALAACPQLAALKALNGANGFDGGGAGGIAKSLIGG